MIKNKRGITLIALVVTIVVLLILAGTSIAMLTGDNGIFNQAKEVKIKNEESAAREKLEIELTNFIAEKNANKEYNENEYIDNKLEEQGMTIIDDIVFVDNWSFQIDRSVPKIVAELGEGKESKDIKLEVTSTINAGYVDAKLNIKITYDGNLSEIRIKGNTETIPTPTNGVYTINKTITENGTYTVVVKDKDGNYKIGTVKITDITEDMEIWNRADMEKFRNMVNSGRTFKGRTVTVMDNINLEGSESNKWVPICNISSNSSLKFLGTFNGNNYTISNIYINSTAGNQGLFGSNNGIIKNVIINSGNIKSTQSSIAGVCGFNYSKIYECINKATITGGWNAGGICGNNSYTARCINFGTIKGLTAAGTGGICGNSNNATIENCYNFGTVSSEGKDSSNHSCTGGISGASQNNSIIRNCYNVGNISATYPYVGGIVGYNGNSSSGTQTVQNVFNSGTIKKGSSAASSNIGSSSAYAGYLIGRYGSLTGKYGNVSSATILGWDNSTITTNLGSEFTKDVKNQNGTWKYNNGYPILKWQLNIK